MEAAYVSSAVHRIMSRSVQDLEFDDLRAAEQCRLSIDPEQPARFQRAVNPHLPSGHEEGSKTPPQLLYRQTSSWSHVDINLDRLNALDSVVLKYQIPWPLDLILNPSVMEKYSVIFTSQLRYRLVEWWLRRVWWKLRETSRTGIKPLRGAAPGFYRLRLVHKWYMVKLDFPNVAFVTVRLWVVILFALGAGCQHTDEQLEGFHATPAASSELD